MTTDWHPEDIKAAVRKRGLTIAAIARRAGMTRQALAMALIRPGQQGEEAISLVLGVHPSTIWPSRYEPSGRRKRPQPAANYTYTPRLIAVAEARP